MKLVSVHGGHSGQFCNHAQDTLEEVVKEYIRQEFTWVGITEHMPAAAEIHVYEDDRKSGMSAEKQWTRFAAYITECRRLQKKYAEEISIYAGVEIETYSHSLQFIRKLTETFNPDYLVGSVHHVTDVGFDYSAEYYEQAVDTTGGMDNLYCAYFDNQYEMIKELRPAVVGHFDLIRMFDDNYKERMKKAAIWQKIERNLLLIQRLGLILDYNQRALVKGAEEPYISAPILERAIELGIAIVPGDDSHGVASVGGFIKEAGLYLQKKGVSTEWKRPA